MRRTRRHVAVPTTVSRRFIGELNEAFPTLDLRPDDVTLVHRGLVPAVSDARGGVGLEGHERVRDHDARRASRAC